MTLQAIAKEHGNAKFAPITLWVFNNVLVSFFAGYALDFSRNIRPVAKSVPGTKVSMWTGVLDHNDHAAPVTIIKVHEADTQARTDLEAAGFIPSIPVRKRRTGIVDYVPHRDLVNEWRKLGAPLPAAFGVTKARALDNTSRMTLPK